MRQPRFTPLLTGVVMLIATATSWADLYQYTDATGRLIIVDNPVLIPPQYQPRVIKESAPTSPKPSSPAPHTERSGKNLETWSSLEPATGAVPIILRGHQVIVPTTVVMKRRRVTLNLLLDTGASITLLDRQAVKKLKLKKLRSGKGQLADGSKVEFDLSQLSRLEIGTRAIENLPVALIDRASKRLHFDGLLGMDVLSRWNYRIDYPNRRLIWE